MAVGYVSWRNDHSFCLWDVADAEMEKESRGKLGLRRMETMPRLDLPLYLTYGTWSTLENVGKPIIVLLFWLYSRISLMIN